MKVSADLLKTIALGIALPMINIGCQTNSDSKTTSVNSASLIEDDTVKRILPEENCKHDSIGLGTPNELNIDSFPEIRNCPNCGMG